MTGAESDTPGLARPELVRVLESAARLQEVVPDAVLVGGSAAAPWASHRTSFDHDHVLQDLSDRFDAVLEAIEATDGWVTNRVTSEVRDLVASSGLSKQDFAGRIGTSRSRLSTYLSGRVVPSATLMVRMRRAARYASETTTHAALYHPRGAASSDAGSNPAGRASQPGQSASQRGWPGIPRSPR
jgi:transcriptional regulator with XRE-family HTH domain